jgi:uncharacterized protein YcaQ
MLPAAIELSVPQARRFMRRAVLLDTPVPTVAPALDHHGYIQIDPINVCGRMHDLIARNRVEHYREGDLMRFLHGGDLTLPASERLAFEHHVPDTNILVAFGLEAWPDLHAAMRARTRRTSAWSGRLLKAEREFARHVLDEIAERGPLNSEILHDGRRTLRSFWSKSTLAKSTMQKMFFHGRLLIARREGIRRFYDLPERVLPAHVLAQPEPSRPETARWLALLKLRQRRLVTLRRDDLPLVEDLIQPVQVPGCPLLYCLRSDVPLLEKPEAEPSERTIHLLAPLDPLIYDRNLTARLWNFDYIWEVYTPPHKRVRGYYARFVLSGLEIVGHVGPKADREKRKLGVVSRRVRRGHPTRPAERALAAWLGLE